MSLFDPLLKFAKHQPGSVIAALIGVILVGSVGGGMWISILQSALDLKRQMLDERIELERERTLGALAAIRSENLTCVQQVDLLRKSLSEVAPAVDRASAALNTISNSSDIDSAQLAEARAAVRKLGEQNKAIEISLGEAERLSHLLNAISEVHRKTAAAPQYWSAQSSAVLALILLVVVFFLGSGAYVLFRSARWGIQRVKRGTS